jgi:hypothetical protein
MYSTHNMIDRIQTHLVQIQEAVLGPLTGSFSVLNYQTQNQTPHLAH